MGHSAHWWRTRARVFSILEGISESSSSVRPPNENLSSLPRCETRALGVILGAHLTDSDQREGRDMGEILGQSALCALCGPYREAREADLRPLLSGL